MILCLETSSSICSVALFDNGSLIALEEAPSINSHSTLIVPMTEAVMKKGGLSFGQLSAVAVSSGPGSYTGLRIGVSTAKGFCDAHDLPLIAVPTLESMAHGFVKENKVGSGLVCPMFDARRMEVYYWLGDSAGYTIDNVQSLVLDPTSFQDHLSHEQIYFLGNGAKKASSVLSSDNASFIPEFHPSAKWLGYFATEKFNNNQFENLAYFEPFYLKDSESHLKQPKKS